MNYAKRTKWIAFALACSKRDEPCDCWKMVNALRMVLLCYDVLGKKYKKRCDFIKTLYLCAKFIKQIKIYRKCQKKD